MRIQESAARLLRDRLPGNYEKTNEGAQLVYCESDFQETMTIQSQAHLVYTLQEPFSDLSTPSTVCLHGSVVRERGCDGKFS